MCYWKNRDNISAYSKGERGTRLLIGLNCAFSKLHHELIDNFALRPYNNAIILLKNEYTIVEANITTTSFMMRMELDMAPQARVMHRWQHYSLLHVFPLVILALSSNNMNKAQLGQVMKIHISTSLIHFLTEDNSEHIIVIWHLLRY
ncbi:hypothetical protein ACJX0J_010392, partial [Zea mays]